MRKRRQGKRLWLQLSDLSMVSSTSTRTFHRLVHRKVGSSLHSIDSCSIPLYCRREGRAHHFVASFHFCCRFFYLFFQLLEGM